MKSTILFVDHDRGCSGATVSMEYLIRAFSRAGWKVLVLSPKDPREAARITDAGGSVVRVKIPGMKDLALNLHSSNTNSPFRPEGLLDYAKNVIKFFVGTVVIWRVIRRSHAGLVYANEYVVIQGSVAGFMCGIPSVLHVRSLMLRGAMGLRRRVLRFLMLACNRRVFAITRLEAEQIAPSGRRSDKVVVVGEFVDAAEPHGANRPAWRTRLGIRQEQVLVSMVGGIDPLKGSLEYLRSAGRVRSTRPDTVFVLAGPGRAGGSREASAYCEECARHVEALREAGALIDLGFVDDTRDIMAGTDILVVPSTLTHFSRPVIEAWHYATPVVVSATDHMRDLVTDGTDGILYSMDDAGALDSALLRLIDSKELRLRLGRAGRKKSRDLFDADRNTQLILGYCGDLLTGTGPGERARGRPA